MIITFQEFLQGINRFLLVIVKLIHLMTDVNLICIVIKLLSLKYYLNLKLVFLYIHFSKNFYLSLILIVLFQNQMNSGLKNKKFNFINIFFFLNLLFQFIYYILRI